MADTVAEQRKLRAEIVFAILLAIIPWTLPVTGILWKCALWGMAWLLLCHWVQGQVRWLGELNWPRKVFAFIVATVFLIAVLYGPVYGLWCTERSAALSGILVAENDGKDHSKEPALIGLGRSGVRLGPTSDNPAWQLPLEKISLRRVNNQLLFSTSIRDSNNNLIVEITDNHWRVSDQKSSCWDKNYTDDSLEVKDGRGRVVLQIRVLPEHIELQAEWSDAKLRFADVDYNEHDGIKPRFKYPSSEHCGELEEK